MKILLLKGLPASGKSTYAKKLTDDGWVRVNKDDLRAMLHNGKWSKINEQQILRIRDNIIIDSLKSGKSVVVDDTNFAVKHSNRVKEIAKEYNAKFETKFFDTPVEECIKRDLKRQNSVGEKVIRQMYEQFLAEKPKVYTPPTNRPHAIICDIDGTLAHMVDREPYDWDKVSNDEVDEPIRDTLERANYDRYGCTPVAVLLISGRDSICRGATEKWLEDYEVPYSKLFMRPEGDKRKDSIVKAELFDKHIKDNYAVDFVLDDRNQVVKMWRDMGLKCLQVAPGEF